MLFSWRSSASFRADRYSGPGALQFFMIWGTSCRQRHLQAVSNFATQCCSEDSCAVQQMLPGLWQQADFVDHHLARSVLVD